MPNRYIRESAIESEAVNSLSFQGEVFYRRLLNRCDDFGRFTANHALLRASLFPLQMDRVRDSDIPRLLAECEKAGLLFVYAVASKQFLVLNKWEQGRAKKSEYPPPPADICERMQTYVYTREQTQTDPRKCKHKQTYGSDSDPDSDPDTDSDNKGAGGGDEVPLPECLNTDVFKAKWAEYEAYRRSAGHRRLKPASVAKQYAELASWGLPIALTAIDQTIRNGWQGLFQPKPQTQELPLSTPTPEQLARLNAF